MAGHRSEGGSGGYPRSPEAGWASERPRDVGRRGDWDGYRAGGDTSVRDDAMGYDRDGRGYEPNWRREPGSGSGEGGAGGRYSSGRSGRGRDRWEPARRASGSRGGGRQTAEDGAGWGGAGWDGGGAQTGSWEAGGIEAEDWESAAWDYSAQDREARSRARGAGDDVGGDDAWDGFDPDRTLRLRRGQDQPDPTGGAEGNERLTGMTGAVLLVLFAVEGITLLRLHQLLTLHFFFGMLLVGPVALKVGSTFYRFVRYYTGAEEYTRKGPPTPLLRLLGPFVVLLSLIVVGSGVMLALSGPSGIGMWLFVHKASFVLWFGAMTIHVLAYVWRLPQLLGGDLGTRAGRRAGAVLAGRPARWLLLSASLLTGVLLAMTTIGRAGLWTGFIGR